MVLMEFHISRAARDRYHTEQALFSFTGNVIFADLKASRELAHSMNVARGTEQDPERVINPGALFAMGLPALLALIEVCLAKKTPETAG